MIQDIDDPIRRLIAIVAHLRSPEGCPWDREQTVASLRPYLVEECYEFLSAIDGDDTEDMAHELGDLLLQVVFYGQLFNEQGAFDIDRAAEAICQKLVRRHPHVFANSQIGNRSELDQQWETIKQTERKTVATSLFSTLPCGLPALQSAQKVSNIAARVGFDWTDVNGVFEKLQEESKELETALQQETSERIEAELGDLLFTAVNLARHLNLDAETTLRKTTDRFIRRFQFIEQSLSEENLTPGEVSPERLNSLWESAKIA